MRTSRRWAYVVISTIGITLLSSCATGPDNKQNSLRPEGESAQKIMNLFSPIFWVATAVGIGVLLATLYIAFRFRATEKNKTPKQVHGNSILEIGWTILPILILIGIAIPTVKTIFELNRKVEPGAIKVEVVGKQWWWQFGVQTDNYKILNVDGTPKLNAEGKPEIADKIVTANELVIPINTDIELSIKACNEDTPVIGKTTEELKESNPCNVVHSFWIPSLGGKIDAVPGRTNRLILRGTKEGLFTGQCSEYCGLAHSVMRMQVRVVPRADFDAWVESHKKPPVASAFAAEGQRENAAQTAIRKFACTNCHSFDDPSAKSFGPNLTHFGPKFDNEVLGGGSIPKTYEHTWMWIHNATDWQNGNGIPMQSDDCRLGLSPGVGKRCNGMPNFSVPYTFVGEDKQESTLPAMTETEAQAIATYLMGNK